MADSELAILEYDLFRRDRPIKNKGGGVLLYVSCELEAVKWVPQSKFPEQIWCTIKRVRGEMLVGVCYRSGNETLFSKENNDKLLKLTAEIKNKQILLIGDFNYLDIEWSRLQAMPEAS